MEYGLVKKIAAWAYANREPNKQEDWIQFCMKRLRILKSFKIFKSGIKKLKTYSSWCAFTGLSNDTTLMQIQSGQTVPLKWGGGGGGGKEEKERRWEQVIKLREELQAYLKK